MPITVACQCGKRYAVAEEKAGRKMRCPACAAIVEIPSTPGGLAEGAATAKPIAVPEQDAGEKMSVPEGYFSRLWKAIEDKIPKNAKDNPWLENNRQIAVIVGYCLAILSAPLGLAAGVYLIYNHITPQGGRILRLSIFLPLAILAFFAVVMLYCLVFPV